MPKVIESRRPFSMRLLIPVLALFPLAGHAGSFGVSTKIAHMGPGDGGEGFYVWAQTLPGSPPISCPNNRFFLRNDAPLRQDSIALLMLAMTQDAAAQLIVRDDQCVSGNYELRAVRLKNPNSGSKAIDEKIEMTEIR